MKQQKVDIRLKFSNVENIQEPESEGVDGIFDCFGGESQQSKKENVTQKNLEAQF